MIIIKRNIICAIIFVLILITSTVVVLAINNNAKNQDEKIARIYQDKKLIYTIDLNSVKKTYRCHLDDGFRRVFGSPRRVDRRL